MATPIRWTARFFAVLVIVAIIIAIDAFLDVDAVGATARFALNFFKFALAWVFRGLETFSKLFGALVRLAVRRRAWRIGMRATSVGFGYWWRTVLNEKQARRVDGWWASMRTGTAHFQKRWYALPLVMKVLIASVLVLIQVMLFPTLSDYILLFPVGFMIPVIVGAGRRIFGWIGDLLFCATYQKYFGHVHYKATRRLRKVGWIAKSRGAVRLGRLRYLTAWRLWKYDPCYRRPSGELKRSLIEPVRLWRNGKLDKYRGQPLFRARDTKRSE
jgi:hypothetical protein